MKDNFEQTYLDIINEEYHRALFWTWNKFTKVFADPKGELANTVKKRALPELENTFVEKSTYSLKELLSMVPEVDAAGNGKNLNIIFRFLKQFDDSDVGFFLGNQTGPENAPLDQENPKSLGILFNPSFYEEFNKRGYSFSFDYEENDDEAELNSSEGSDEDDINAAMTDNGEDDDAEAKENIEETDNISESIIGEGLLGDLADKIKRRKTSEKAGKDVKYHILDSDNIDQILAELKKCVKQFGFTFKFDKLTYVDKVPEKKKNNANFVSGMSRTSFSLY